MTTTARPRPKPPAPRARAASPVSSGAPVRPRPAPPGRPRPARAPGQSGEAPSAPGNGRARPAAPRRPAAPKAPARPARPSRPSTPKAPERRTRTLAELRASEGTVAPTTGPGSKTKRTNYAAFGIMMLGIIAASLFAFSLLRSDDPGDLTKGQTKEELRKVMEYKKPGTSTNTGILRGIK